MAQFNWIQHASQGCPFCMTPVSERGFVDCIADTVVRNSEGEVTGVVDLFICAQCTEQMARLVGSLTMQESLEIMQDLKSMQEEGEKLKDESAAWQQRYNNLLNNLSEDLGAFVKEEKNASSGKHPSRSSSSKPA